MANPAWSDMETIFTTSQLRELSDDEVWTSMIDTAAASPTGTEMLVPVTRPSTGETERIPYVFDGDQYWHRGDLRVADMQRKIGQRLAAMKPIEAETVDPSKIKTESVEAETMEGAQSDTSRTHEEGQSGS